LAYASIIYAFVWITGLGGFYNKAFVDLVARDFGFGPLPQWADITFYFFFTATIAVVKDFATVLGEEIGWRGFLVPELAKRHGFVATSLISGIIWALWHYPILLLGSYHSRTPVWYYLPLFTVTVTTINFLWTWMRLKSGSIWPCVFLHAAHNTFIQRFFDPLTVFNTKTWYVATEFGAALTVVSILMAVYFSRRRGEVEAFSLQPSKVTSVVQTRIGPGRSMPSDHPVLRRKSLFADGHSIRTQVYSGWIDKSGFGHQGTRPEGVHRIIY
jgi:membrane protease YdiL (CAAX protease family)